MQVQCTVDGVGEKNTLHTRTYTKIKYEYKYNSIRNTKSLKTDLKSLE